MTDRVRPRRARRLAWRRALAALGALGILAGVAAAVLVPEVDVNAAESGRSELRPDPLDVITAPWKLVGSTRRQVLLRPDRVELLQGATVLDSIPIDGRHATLPGLAAAVAGSRRPGWLARAGPGVFLLRVALAQARGTQLTVAAPAVRQLRLLTDPEVYVAAVGARGIYRRVSVSSWDERANRPEPSPTVPRPFLRYGPGSVLDVERSRFGYLGSERSKGASGVSWEGATGKAVASTFHNNLLGASTFQSHDIAFVGNVFRDNALSGLDARDFSTGLQVVANRAYHNGADGTAFSLGVTDAVVRENYVFENGANGIVMDERSNRNLILGNLVEGNKGDGIVLLGSSDMALRYNEVRGHRVGIRINLRSARNVVEHNLVERSRRGVELYGGARETRLAHNQILDSAGEAVLIEAPDSVSTGDMIRGARIGVEVRGLAHLYETSVSGVTQGIVVTGRGIVTIDQAMVEATGTAVHVQPGGLARVDASRLDAPEPFKGATPRDASRNLLVSPGSALPLLALTGAAFLVLAVVLQVVHRPRDRPTSLPKEGPTGAWNPS
jgi:parallel beta-helix repeat protein